MKKNIDQLEVGDWVALSSLTRSRFCGYPWKVTRIAESRIYIESYGVDPKTNQVEVKDNKYVARKSVVLAFSTEAEAMAATNAARELSETYEATIRQLEKEHKQRVQSYMESLL